MTFKTQILKPPVLNCLLVIDHFFMKTRLGQHLDQTKTKSKFCGEKKIKICRFRIGYWMAWSLLVFLLFYLVAF